MKTSINSYVMHVAHVLHRNRPDFKWSDILRHAWYFAHLRGAFHQGVVTFTYLKKDNSIRDAKGTLNELLIPVDDRPKGLVRANESYAIFTYFDLDRKAWRSFDIRLFVGYVDCFRLTKIPLD